MGIKGAHASVLYLQAFSEKYTACMNSHMGTTVWFQLNHSWTCLHSSICLQRWVGSWNNLILSAFQKPRDPRVSVCRKGVFLCGVLSTQATCITQEESRIEFPWPVFSSFLSSWNFTFSSPYDRNWKREHEEITRWIVQSCFGRSSVIGTNILRE